MELDKHTLPSYVSVDRFPIETVNEILPSKPLVPKPLVPKPLVPESLVPESLVPKPLVPKPLVPKPLVPESLVPEPVIPEPTVAKPFATTVSTSDPKHPKSLGLDPLTIDMNDTVALYDSSSRNGKKQLECEEAIRLEGLLNELYTSQSGRSRGWTKTGLTALLQPRCASGGDIKELEKSKKAFLWALVVDDKVYSSFLDYICVAKQIRVAVWFEEDKYVVLFPAADRTTCPADTIPLYNITSKGLPHRRVNTCEDLLSYCDTNNLVLMPPHSIFHSLSTLTLSELESVGTKMGCIGVTGTKKERVAKLANWKLRQRLLS